MKTCVHCKKEYDSPLTYFCSDLCSKLEKAKIYQEKKMMFQKAMNELAQHTPETPSKPVIERCYLVDEEGKIISGTAHGVDNFYLHLIPNRI